MKKATYEVNLAYTFDPAHKGANYTFDGEHWTNGGEFAEVMTKAVLGYVPEKDANTRYDKASDIPEMNASVKSSRFTLVNFALADTFEESINRYFETVHSTLWIYTIIVEDTVTLYYMNRKEFERFLYTFCFLNERNVVRCKVTSGKMIKWLEERIS